MNNNKPLTGFDLPYSYLIDNIKAILIYLVVFNHLVAFALVKEDNIIRHIWYGITIFHMPAFVFVSGYLSKNKQSQYKNFKNLLIPYVLGYTFTWAATVWTEQSMSYDLLRPSGTAMWYLLALYVYRSSIEAVSRIRFVVPLTIVFAVWAGTRPEFSTYLSVSRIVVFFPFFIAGYLWSNKTTQRLRTFKGKWVLFFLSATVLTMIPVYMINQQIPIDLLRENHDYLMSGVSSQVGITLRLLMFLTSFIVILTMLALVPNFKTPLTFLGRNTMSIYFIHYPLLIALNGMKVLRLPSLMNGPANALISLAIVVVLGCPPIHWLYSVCMSLISKIILRPIAVEQEASQGYLQDEYDSNDDYFAYVNEEEEELPRGKEAPRGKEPLASAQSSAYGGGYPGSYQGNHQSSYPEEYQSRYSQGNGADYGSEYSAGPNAGYSGRSQGPISQPGSQGASYQGGYGAGYNRGSQQSSFQHPYSEDYESTFPGPNSYPEDYEDYEEDTFPGPDYYPQERGAESPYKGGAQDGYRPGPYKKL